MCQEIVKLLLEVYFATMFAGKLSKMCWQSFRMFPHTWNAFGTAQNGNTSTTKIMGQEIVKLLPEVHFADMLLLLEVYFAAILAGKLSKMCQQCFTMFSPPPDCLWHSQKWQYIGHKNNGSRNHEIATGNVI